MGPSIKFDEAAKYMILQMQKEKRNPIAKASTAPKVSMFEKPN